MSVIDYPVVYVPVAIDLAAGVPTTLNANPLNASGSKGAYLFYAPKTGSIHKIGFFIGTVTTATDSDFRVETVASQLPSGTLWAANTNIVIASASIVASTMLLATLTADADVTIGDAVAVVLAPANTANYQWLRLNGGSNFHSCYPTQHNGTSWAQATGATCIGLVEYDDGTYAHIQGLYPVMAMTAVAFSSASTPDHVGMKFSFPVNTRITGGWLAIALAGAPDMVLIDSDGTTVLQTATLNAALTDSTAGRSAYYFKFPAAQTLLRNTSYYMALRPNATTSSVYHYTCTAANKVQHLGTFDMVYSSAKDPTGTGDWTDVTTRVPLMGVEVNGVEAGGSLVHGRLIG